MDLVTADQFLSWLNTTSIAFDGRYEEPRCLVYFPYRTFHRFWEVPPQASNVPHFVSTLLDGMDAWGSCHVWPRGGLWPSAHRHEQVGDRVRRLILSAAGIPEGFSGAVRFDAADLDRLVTVAFAYLSFGWNVRDDLFIIPDHARQLLHADHHDVIHVEFADEPGVAPFVHHMQQKGFPLPEDPPDPTFKTPDWMG